MVSSILILIRNIHIYFELLSERTTETALKAESYIFQILSKCHFIDYLLNSIPSFIFKRMRCVKCQIDIDTHTHVH